MMFVVTLVSLLVHIYSTEYMRGDRPLHPLLRLPVAVHRVDAACSSWPTTRSQMLVGWELVGLCSFMLIGHWWEEKPNSDAALKAFLTTRTGDIGLLTGVIMTFFMVQRAFGAGLVQHRAGQPVGGGVEAPRSHSTRASSRRVTPSCCGARPR